MPRQQVSYESMVAQAKEKIKENPQRALREIGKFLVKRIRKAASRSKVTRTYFLDGRKIVVKPGRLRRSIGYWYRRREGDLQIGSKAFYAHWEEFGSSNNQKRPFLEPTIDAEREVIQEMIQDALKELNKK